MVVQAGQPKGWPVRAFIGIANPVWATVLQFMVYKYSFFSIVTLKKEYSIW
ncbi:ash family protein [Salmonella enterica]|nr:ash family protein [Salmonella enterica]ELX1376504.1 ash family protein [Salmonella enterica]